MGHWSRRAYLNQVNNGHQGYCVTAKSLPAVCELVSTFFSLSNIHLSNNQESFLMLMAFCSIHSLHRPLSNIDRICTMKGALSMGSMDVWRRSFQQHGGTETSHRQSG